MFLDVAHRAARAARPFWRSKILLDIAIIYKSIGDYTKFTKFINEALEHINKLGDEEYVLLTGDVIYDLLYVEENDVAYDLIVKYTEKISDFDPELILRAYKEISENLAEYGFFHDAIAYAINAVSLLERKAEILHIRANMIVSRARKGSSSWNQERLSPRARLYSRDYLASIMARRRDMYKTELRVRPLRREATEIMLTASEFLARVVFEVLDLILRKEDKEVLNECMELIRENDDAFDPDSLSSLYLLVGCWFLEHDNFDEARKYSDR